MSLADSVTWTVVFYVVLQTKSLPIVLTQIDGPMIFTNFASNPLNHTLRYLLPLQRYNTWLQAVAKTDAGTTIQTDVFSNK